MKPRLVLLVLFLLSLAAPVMAQDGGIHTVAYDGFAFSFDAALASNVTISQFAGDPVDLEQPGGPQAPYTEFLIYNGTPAPQSWWDAAGVIRVYGTADLAAYSTHQTELANLQNLLATRADLTPYMQIGDINVEQPTLPFLPIFPAHQVIRARAQYIDTPMLAGISYVTAFRQDVSPFIGSEFLYTFQGLSGDGLYYVAGFFRLNTPLFPAETPADLDYDEFVANFQTYLNDSITTLNNAAPTDFTPSLDLIEPIVQSMGFAG